MSGDASSGGLAEAMRALAPFDGRAGGSRGLPRDALSILVSAVGRRPASATYADIPQEVKDLIREYLEFTPEFLESVVAQYLSKPAATERLHGPVETWAVARIAGLPAAKFMLACCATLSAASRQGPAERTMLMAGQHSGACPAGLYLVCRCARNPEAGLFEGYAGPRSFAEATGALVIPSVVFNAGGAIVMKGIGNAVPTDEHPMGELFAPALAPALKLARTDAPGLSAADATQIEHELSAAVAADDWPEVLRRLGQLRSGNVSVDVLMVTTIGRTVAALKKSRNFEITLAARALVGSWKRLIREQEGELEFKLVPANDLTRGLAICAGVMSLQPSRYCDASRRRILVGTYEFRAQHHARAGEPLMDASWQEQIRCFPVPPTMRGSAKWPWESLPLEKLGPEYMGLLARMDAQARERARILSWS